MKKRSFLIICAFLMVISIKVSGQVDVGDKVKNQTDSRIDQRTGEGIDGGLDAFEGGIKGILRKKDKSKPAESQENNKSEQTAEDQNGNDSRANSGVQDQTSLQSYSRYDFTPGEKVLFFDDFTETAIGDFPPNWNTNASGEVLTTNLYPGNWFKMIGEGSVALDEGLKLPDNYTIEYDVVSTPAEEGNNSFEFGFYLYGAENPKDLKEGGAVPGKGGIKLTFGYRATFSAYDETGYTMDGSKDDAIMDAGKKYRLSFWVQKTRLRVYLDQVKIFDLPKVMKAGFQCNMMRFELWNSGIPMITNFRVAAGLPDMRNKLITEGKLVSYGIYFDVNKDVVKPESNGTLKGIADVLKENPTVSVKIVGHTDTDGAEAANFDLSKRRGASVKNELVKSFGIDASRLESDGMGETKPVAPNDTPSNKAMNRRVEFIKL